MKHFDTCNRGPLGSSNIKALREILSLVIAAGFSVTLIIGCFTGFSWHILFLLGWLLTVLLGHKSLARLALNQLPKIVEAVRSRK